MASEKEIHAKSFLSELVRELQSRQAKNPQYSLRAFSLFLDISPAHLSNLLKEKRSPSLAFVKKACLKLGWNYVADSRESDAAKRSMVTRTSAHYYARYAVSQRKKPDPRLNSLIGRNYVAIREDGTRWEHRFELDPRTGGVQVFRDHRGPEFSEDLWLMPSSKLFMKNDWLMVIFRLDSFDIHCFPLSDDFMKGRAVSGSAFGIHRVFKLSKI